jgi:hypothetical protein
LSVVWLVAALCVAVGEVRAQTFRLPVGEDLGPVIVPPGSDPMFVPPSAGGDLTAGAGDFVNADEYVDPADSYAEALKPGGPWSWQVLPTGLVYRSYLGNIKESRMNGGVDSSHHDSNLWDATLGSRLGIFRYGTSDYILPDGFQVDVEGSAQLRLDIPEDVDVRSVDFRGGVPITYGLGAHRFKFGYYHLSSHLGDEFLLKNSGYPRMNFARDVLILGYSYYATPNLRLYGEAGWAFYSIVSEPWEFQAGLDFAPQYRTGIRGAPFFTLNGHIRQELDYSGNFTTQAGWAWRADNGPQLLRIGVQYFSGYSNQYAFAFKHEQTIGVGVWYDF